MKSLKSTKQTTASVWFHQLKSIPTSYWFTSSSEQCQNVLDPHQLNVHTLLSEYSQESHQFVHLSSAWVKSGAIDWQSLYLTVQRSPLTFQSLRLSASTLIRHHWFSRYQIKKCTLKKSDVCLESSSLVYINKPGDKYLKSSALHWRRWLHIYSQPHTGTFLSPSVALC